MPKKAEYSSLALVAAWLATEIGVGGTFTKQALRSAIPEYEQADRRMRDLRDYGWQIDTRKQDASLEINELRLVALGQPVWDASFQTKKIDRVSALDRRNALVAASFMCQLCGIGSGEAFMEYPGRRARLVVKRASEGLTVICDACGAPGASNQAVDQAKLNGLVAKLSPVDQARLFARAATSLEITELDRILSLARRLPADSREDWVKGLPDWSGLGPEWQHSDVVGLL